MLNLNDYQKIGLGLLLFGIAFLFLGILLLFDKGLLAIGNILFLCGFALVAGLDRTGRFFFQKEKVKGSVFFFGGIVVVILVGWPVIGMMIELYGIYSLFGGFLPVAFSYLQGMPFIGVILRLPPINRIVVYLSRGTGKNSV